MSDGSERLAELRRLDSEVKVTRVLATVDAMVVGGDALPVAGIARRAGVSRRFIYDHPELRAEIERRSAEMADRFTGRVIAGARTTAASIKADLEHAKAHNRRLQVQVGRLERRLSEVLGQEVRAEIAGSGIVDAERLSARVDELEAQLLVAHDDIRRRDDELDASRQINRELMARVNREG